MRARNVTWCSSGQGVMIRRLVTTSCSRSVVMRVSDHSRHVLLGASHLLGLCSLGHRRVTRSLCVHLRLVAWGWRGHSPASQGHRAVQMNFGNSGLNRQCANLFAALHGLCGRRLLCGQSIPSSTGDVPACHAAQGIVNWVTRNARRRNLSAPRKVMIRTFVSVEAHFLCSGIFTLAKADTQSQWQTADSSARALACETRGGAVASASWRQHLVLVCCCL